MAQRRTSPPRNLTECDRRPWPRTLEEAKTLQAALTHRVRLSRLKRPVRFVGGADASFTGDITVGVIAVLDLHCLDLVEFSCCVLPTAFPYIPGYLSFREGPALVEAFYGLRTRPDVLICDGQGIAHPRGLGLASHLGLLLSVPSIGCAKSRLVGEYAEPPLPRGCWTRLILNRRTVGAVLRTRTAVRPLFVSPGHRITLAESLNLVLACSKGYRLPEPLRQADGISRRLRREVTSDNAGLSVQACPRHRSGAGQ